MSTSNSIVLSCLDEPGLIFKITKLFHESNINITSLEEHVEDAFFFIRVQWDDSRIQSKHDLHQLFDAFLKQHKASMNIRLSTEPFKVVLMCSKPLHCLLHVLYQAFFKDVSYEVVAVISNHKDAEPFVENLGIPFHFCNVSSDNRKEHEQRILSILSTYSFECIGLARYMRVLSAEFLAQVKKPIINVHHSFLPSFKGADPYKQAFDRGVKVIGATAHYVTQDLDEGPIIDQDVLKVNHLSFKHDLTLLGQETEKSVFSKALLKQSENKIVTFNGKTIVFN